MADLANPPKFQANKDLQVWRRDVAKWVQAVKTASEKGQDKRYKTIFAVLSTQLYTSALGSYEQSQVDWAAKNGEVDLKQEDQIPSRKSWMLLQRIHPMLLSFD